jgi:hypothetical protein
VRNFLSTFETAPFFCEDPVFKKIQYLRRHREREREREREIGANVEAVTSKATTTFKNYHSRIFPHHITQIYNVGS